MPKSNNTLECQPLITAMKKYTKSINNLNTSTMFLRKELIDFRERKSLINRILRFLRNDS